MKTKIISKLLLSFGLVFVLGSAITQVRGENQAIEANQAIEVATPVVSIHSAGDVIRGKSGSFVLDRLPISMFAASTYVNVSVGGTAVAGVDYVAVVSPTLIGASGYGVITIKTLPNQRAISGNQAYSVIVKLLPGPGYTVVSASAASSSTATMWIRPCTSSAANCQ
jgi:hypothetical protein